MKAILQFILVLFVFLMLSRCDESNNKALEKDDSEVIYLCLKPKTNNIIKSYVVNEYFVPGLLENHLDTIIQLEMNCFCYRKDNSGFIVNFSNLSKDSVSISIVSLDAVQAHDYSCFNGFFVYKNHYFACVGNEHSFSLVKKRIVTVMAFMPLPEMPEIYDGWSKYSFIYANEKLEKKEHYPCIKSKIKQ